MAFTLDSTEVGNAYTWTFPTMDSESEGLGPRTQSVAWVSWVKLGSGHNFMAEGVQTSEYTSWQDRKGLQGLFSGFCITGYRLGSPGLQELYHEWPAGAGMRCSQHYSHRGLGRRDAD